MTDKYISPEHVIRNLLTERSVDTDKFQGTANAFFKSVSIQTKKDGEHIAATGPVRVARIVAVAKQRNSETENMGEEVLGERVIDLPSIKKTKIPDIEVPPPVKPIEISPGKGDIELPSVKPDDGTTGKIKPNDLPSTKPKPDDTPSGKPKPDDTPSGKPKPDDTPSGKPKPDKNTSGKAKPKRTFIPFWLPGGATPGQNIAVGSIGVFGVPGITHFAGEPREYAPWSVKTEETRYDVENVPRPGKKRNMKNSSRQAEIIRKVLDEKRKQNSTVNLKPKTNDELQEGKAKALVPFAAGAGVGVGTGTMDRLRSYNTPTGSEKDPFGLENKAYGSVDAALDIASMAPIIGTPAAAYSTWRAAQRGDWADAGLNALSMIPGLGTFLKGGKLLGKGVAAGAKLVGASQTASKVAKTADTLGKAGEITKKVGNPASMAASGLQVGQLGKDIHQTAKEIQKQTGSSYGTALTDMGKEMGSEIYKGGETIYKKGKETVKPYLGY
jgi:hypothetical protein